MQMADTQAEKAQGTEGAPAAPAAPTNGEEPKTVPMERFKELYAEMKAGTSESARQIAELRQTVAELQAQQKPHPPPDEDLDEDARLKKLLQEVNAPLTQGFINLADRVDKIDFERMAGSNTEEAKAAEETRLRLLRQGIPVNRKDALIYTMGQRALEERTKAAADEAARQRANRAAFTENAPGAPPPDLPADFDRLPSEERANALAKRMGDTPI